MTPSDDPRDEMARFLSPDQVEQVLSGAAAPEDLPVRAAGIAQLLSVMSAEDASVDLVREDEAVATIGAAIRNAPTNMSTHGDRRRSSRSISTKSAVAAFAIVLVSGTAAAAATGSLPDPAQRFVSRALSRAHIGIPSPKPPAPKLNGKVANAGAGPDEPRGHSEVTQTTSAGATNRTDGTTAVARGPVVLPTEPARGGTGGSTRTTTGSNAGTDAPGSGRGAKRGLCKNGNANSVARSKLEQAAAAAGLTVTEYCADVPGVTTTTSGAANAETPTTAKQPAKNPAKKPAEPPGQSKKPSVTTPKSNGNAQQGKRSTGDGASGQNGNVNAQDKGSAPTQKPKKDPSGSSNGKARGGGKK